MFCSQLYYFISVAALLGIIKRMITVFLVIQVIILQNLMLIDVKNALKIHMHFLEHPHVPLALRDLLQLGIKAIATLAK